MNAVADFGDMGRIWFHQCSPGKRVLVRFDLRGLAAGSVHGCHIHQYGDIASGCSSAGPHFNPHGQQHGCAADGKKRHAGDMTNNVTADSTGTVQSEYWDDLISLAITDVKADNSIIGRSVVIHDGIDDLGRGGTPLSKETGNSGGRLKCAVIGLTGTEVRHGKKDAPIP